MKKRFTVSSIIINIVLIAMLGFSTIGCVVDVNKDSDEIGNPFHTKAIDFGGAASKTIDLSGQPADKKIYLVTVNTDAYYVSGTQIGGAVPSVYGEFSGSEIDLSDPSGSLLDNEAVPPGHHPGAVAFNANPPPITPDMLQNRALSFSGSLVPYTVGTSTKNFKVETTFGSSSFIQKSATLLAQGIYCNIWAIGGWGTTVTTPQAEALRNKFDQIYPLETKVLGYEYGGGPGGSGGRDGDGRIQILVYDFYGDSSGSGNTAGFYWGKDFYPATSQPSSNEAEIFYISAPHLNSSPDMIYSTLVHEFQHMINFNVKSIRHGLSSQSWYNEMLSMMAEDMISPLIGIAPTNQGHPIRQRISGFLTSYADEGITRWQGTTSDPGDSLKSYSYKYAFGAYLARNYGGAQLMKNLLANNTANNDSVVAAVQQTTGNGSVNFNYLLEKFAEAFIYSNPADGGTLNKTDAKTISGTIYTFTGFDIWDDYDLGGGYVHSPRWTGPTVYALTSHPNMQPYSVFVQSAGDWDTGSKSSVTLNRPASSSVKLFLMVR